MRPHDIARAIRNLLAYLRTNGLSIEDEFHILNHYRWTALPAAARPATIPE